MSISLYGAILMLLFTRQLTVILECRKQGLAKRLIDILEDVTENPHEGYFVDLFVRVSNAAAITMYKKVRTSYLQVLLVRLLWLYANACIVASDVEIVNDSGIQEN